MLVALNDYLIPSRARDQAKVRRNLALLVFIGAITFAMSADQLPRLAEPERQNQCSMVWGVTLWNQCEWR
jgi:hypothetical protein